MKSELKQRDQDDTIITSGRVGRAVHGAGLENQWAQALTGSNPVLSAIKKSI
jgi:hypothetical protein